MHSATQIIAQRGTPAARTKTRWQPYTSIPSTSNIPARSPPPVYVHTPTFVPPSSPHIATSFSDLNRLRTGSFSGVNAFPTQTPKDLQRETSKNKFAAGLVDQAVKTLSEVWRPHDIPTAFLPPSTTLTQSASAAIKSLTQKHPLAFENESSSPISSSVTSNPSHTSTSTTISNTTTPTSLVSGNDSDQILPIRSFVHEVLRRSRTSGIVLQTALCYLEAIRPEIPNLLREERMGIRAYYEPESRILPATEAELAQEAKLKVLENERESNDDSMDTIRITDSDDFESGPKTFHEESAASSSTSLPSPLLCPRRTFLASVILASKFSQDKCYSNRAWAKLSGLPPREIGRCERALGQALEWRLWVGKTLLSSQTPTPSVNQIARSQSEGSISIQSTTHSQFLNQENMPGSADLPMSSSHRRGLRKSATLPANAFLPQHQTVSVVPTTSNFVDNQEANDTPEWKVNSQPSSSKLPDQPSVPQTSPFTTESPSPETPGLTYSPSTTDCSSETRTVQMTLFEDNVFPSGKFTQAWLEANDAPNCKFLSYQGHGMIQDPIGAY